MVAVKTFGRAVGRRRLSSRQTPTRPTDLDLDRERQAWHADTAALAAAEQAVEEAEAAREDVDPDLEQAEWHAACAEREQAVMHAIRERERLAASTENRRERCLTIATEIASQPIQEAEQRIAVRGSHIEELVAAVAALERSQAVDERHRDDLRDARDKASREFLTSDRRAARAAADSDLQTQARWHARQVIDGLPVPPPTKAIARILDREIATLRNADRAAREPHELTRAELAAGISRLSGDGSPARLL